jgi:hypothetical protein
MAYGTTDELLRRLSIRSATADQTEQAQACLDAASADIDWDLGIDPVTNPAPDPVPAVYTNVCYGRARELWNLGYATFGAQLLASDLLAYAGNDSWSRWHVMLQPVRAHEGIA